MAFPNFSISEEMFALENYGFEPLEVTPKDGCWSINLRLNPVNHLMVLNDGLRLL